MTVLLLKVDLGVLLVKRPFYEIQLVLVPDGREYELLLHGLQVSSF